MGMFTSIVVAIDFSEMSPDILHYALQIAAPSPGAVLHVLHVVPDPLQQPWAPESIGIDFVSLEKGWVADAHRHMDELLGAEGFAAAGAKPVIRVGRAAETIVGQATTVEADIIIMGTHGYGPVKRFMLGSVAEHVLRQATCPVLTIPHRCVKTMATETDSVAVAKR